MSTSAVSPGRSLPDPDVEPTFLADRCAIILGVSRSAVYGAIARGEIPHVRVGRSVRILTRRFLEQFFPEALPTEFDMTTNSDAATRENNTPSHGNITTPEPVRALRSVRAG